MASGIFSVIDRYIYDNIHRYCILTSPPLGWLSSPDGFIVLYCAIYLPCHYTHVMNMGCLTILDFIVLKQSSLNIIITLLLLNSNCLVLNGIIKGIKRYYKTFGSLYRMQFISYLNSEP